jgi:hypothetical protein
MSGKRKASITITVQGQQHSYYVDEAFAGEILFMCETSTGACSDDITPLLGIDIMDQSGSALFEWDIDSDDDEYDDEDYDDEEHL